MLQRYLFAFFTIIQIGRLTVNSSPDVLIACHGLPSFTFMRMIHLPSFFSYFPIGWGVLTLQTDEKIEPPHADGDEEKGDLEKENRTVNDDVPNQNAAMSACLRTFQAAQAEMSQLINLIDLSRGDQFVSVERVTKTLPLSVSNNGSILSLVVAIGCIM